MTNFDSARPRHRAEHVGQIDAVRGAEQVKISELIPVTHYGEPVEQRNIVLLRHHPHII